LIERRLAILIRKPNAPFLKYGSVDCGNTLGNVP
jgi:hypothetical protein